MKKTIFIISLIVAVFSGANMAFSAFSYWEYAQFLHFGNQDQGDDLRPIIFQITLDNSNYEMFSYGLILSEGVCLQKTGIYTVAAESIYITIYQSNAPDEYNRIGMSFPIKIFGEPYNKDQWLITNAKTLTCGWAERDTLLLIGSFTGVYENTRPQSESISLSQNYPNPFNSETTIPFILSEPSPLKIKVFTINGQKVQEFVYDSIDEGKHEIVFNGSGLASGIYFYRIESNSAFKNKKMLLIK